MPTMRTTKESRVKLCVRIMDAFAKLSGADQDLVIRVYHTSYMIAYLTMGNYTIPTKDSSTRLNELCRILENMARNVK